MFCKECKYWIDADDEDVDGWCHRYPPSYGEDFDSLGLFPRVEPDDWCGEFEKPQLSLAEMREEE